MKQIKTFWNWFQDNEESINNAILLGINTKEVLYHLNRNYSYISKRIGFLIVGPSKNQNKYTIIFTSDGYRKLFPKLIALENQAPQLRFFIPQAFVKPIHDKSLYLTGNDEPYIFKNIKIKISQLYMSLVDYNISSKQLKINIYIPGYDRIKDYDEVEIDLKYLVMEVIGEIAFRKHIKNIEFLNLPQANIGFLSLIELPEYIDYLYKINSRGKTLKI
jgi:hypothetical protein